MGVEIVPVAADDDDDFALLVAAVAAAVLDTVFAFVVLAAAGVPDLREVGVGELPLLARCFASAVFLALDILAALALEVLGFARAISFFRLMTCCCKLDRFG